MDTQELKISETFAPKDITERIKTFEDACRELGDEHPFIKAWNSIYQGDDGQDDSDIQDVIAYHKLRIICAALNEGWRPTFGKDEHRYYPWFWLYTGEEYEALDDDRKEVCLAVGQSGSVMHVYSGIIYAIGYYTSSLSYAYRGSRLALKSKDLAEYAGRQFLDIWAKFISA